MNSPSLDTDKEPIQAHGGGVLFHEGVYYWFGENKTLPNNPGTTRTDVVGVSCYSSRDLLHWKNEGVVLPAVPDDSSHDLHPSKVAERPKVIFNRATGKYVMWLHVDSPDYTAARAGVAVADSPVGPFTYVGSIQPNGKDSRDLTLFQDGDERAYLVHSSDWNSVLMIADLSDDYLETTGHVTRHFDHGKKNTGRESPALFRHGGRYFIITSGTTGWAPNAAEYAVADSVHGPWRVKGNPCLGPDAEVTFGAQDTFVLPITDRPGEFIFMADRWDKENLRASAYLWLPLKVEGEAVEIRTQNFAHAPQSQIPRSPQILYANS